jgi:membrane protein DedA with SNARE-associated domain
MTWLFELWRANALLALGAVLFLAGLGVPSPASILIIATGALAHRGRVDLFPAFAIGLIAASSGDLVSYTLARGGLSGWLEKRKQKREWHRTIDKFERNAPLTIFLARWLLTPISLACTYIAGSSRYPVAKFLAASLPGQAMWIFLYGSVGYALGRDWRNAGGWLPYVGGAAAVLTAVAIAYYFLKRRFRQAA